MEQDFIFTNFSFDNPSSLDYKVESKEVKKGPVKKTLWENIWSKNKFKNPKMVAILFLRNNGKAENTQVESKKGFFDFAGKSYHEDKDCIYRLGKDSIPLAIIEEDSLLPIGTKRYYDRYPAERDIQFIKRKLMEAQDHILRGIRHAEFVRMGEQTDKKPINTKAIIIWGIIGIVLYALWKGGTFG